MPSLSQGLRNSGVGPQTLMPSHSAEKCQPWRVELNGTFRSSSSVGEPQGTSRSGPTALLMNLITYVHLKWSRTAFVSGVGRSHQGLLGFHLFQWKQLENLYFREKKFAVEVHDPRRLWGTPTHTVPTEFLNSSVLPPYLPLPGLVESYPSFKDPALQELESNFVIQQKLVEAAKKLANEPDLCKNVKRKRKQDYADAVKKLQEIENAINEYRITCGKKPSQKATLILPEDIIPSESSSLSDTTTYDDANDSFTLPAQRSSSVPHSPRIPPPKSLGLERIRFRKSSINEQLMEGRQSREILSTHSSPYRTLERRPQGGRSMPTTPVLTRNAYSSSHLEPNSSPQHCRQRSGSLESQTHLLSELDGDKPFFSLSKSQRSSSTEILDDGSSYTSQSSAEYYCVTPSAGPYYTTQTLDTRTRGRRRSKKHHVSTSNSGSMPNLAPKDMRNGGYPKSHEQPSCNYFISGYPPYAECDLYYSGAYVFENDTEGQYSVNPSYRSSAHYGYDRHKEYRSYHEDEMDRVPHNPYATLRLPRKAPVKSEHITKNIHKALVAEHLRGWYQRASGHKDLGHGLQASFDSDRGSQRSLGFAPLQVPCSPSSRASSYTSVSSTTASGNWRTQITLGLADPLSHSSYTSCYGNVYSPLPPPSRQYAEASQLDCTDGSRLENDLDNNEQRLYWHEDSKPGTLV
ncbi:FERM domain-containing protein 4B [Gracilinanus agilis]|uniref:FERM domain-containing protein 4B n=1 Tax=Gracilinanus agilis TaxID=191870 RepID=UPI001CFC9EF9|nr:FERM domain-containing protein 4B [Gracilinanus agilis]